MTIRFKLASGEILNETTSPRHLDGVMCLSPNDYVTFIPRREENPQTFLILTKQYDFTTDVLWITVKL